MFDLTSIWINIWCMAKPTPNINSIYLFASWV